MDVRDLAPALLAWDALIGQASDLVSNGKAEARLQVQGSFKEGSLEPLLKIVETAAEIFRDDWIARTAVALGQQKRESLLPVRRLIWQIRLSTMCLESSAGSAGGKPKRQLQL